MGILYCNFFMYYVYCLEVQLDLQFFNRNCNVQSSKVKTNNVQNVRNGNFQLFTIKI